MKILYWLLGFSTTVALLPSFLSAAELTRIIGTGDPIPGSLGLTAGDVYRNPKIRNGKIAFFTGHKEFGVDKPSNTLLYWDGQDFSKVADDFTPVPNLAGGQMLEFNDLTRTNSLSFDINVDPTVVFYASYGNPDEYAIYRWSPGKGIRAVATPSANLSNIKPGIMSNGILVFPTWPVNPGTSLNMIGVDGTLKQLVKKGDEIPDSEFATFDFIHEEFFFEDSRVLVNLSTKPISMGGWYEFRLATPQLPKPVWTANDRIESVNGAFTYWSNGIRGISSSIGESPSSVVGIGQGTANGSPSSSILFKNPPSASFGVLAASGESIPGLPGYTFFRFNDALVYRRSAIFAATAVDSQFDEVIGIFRKEGEKLDILIDTRSVIDGKQVTSVNLHDVDGDTGVILFTAWFDDNTAALYTLPIVGALSFDLWTQEEFPESNGDQAVVGAFADPERDGVVNVVEFALGGQGNALDPGSTVPTVVATSPGESVELEFRRRIELPDGITVTPEMSTSLEGQWHSGPQFIEEVSAVADSDPAFERVRIRGVGATGDNVYFRIAVSAPGG